MKRPLLQATTAELAGWMAERGYPGYRAKQVIRWVFERRGTQFDAMSDLPKGLRADLEAEWVVFQMEIAHQSVAPDGTDKLLLSCSDGRRVECVLIPEGDRRTVCISTQVGCGMGCVFCASGLKGVERNLTSGEILEQVIQMRNLLPEDGRLSNIVVMGMGESLANLDNLIVALDRICSTEGLGMSQRRVTISTVGLPEKMRALAALDRQYHLAVSLHAPTEQLRNELVPINDKIGLTAVVEAADAYFRSSGRRVTYEYVMLRGINDRAEDASAMVGLLRARKAHVNLIPYNPVAGLPYERPSPASVRRFEGIVSAGGVSVSVRKTKGQEIDAACGQLRKRVEDAATAVAD
ncbi:23S rRNA (adenine(2503)-C(2))-methyltransferase RlmN [Isosphaeraceae bacterium EP7]